MLARSLGGDDGMVSSSHENTPLQAAGFEVACIIQSNTLDRLLKVNPYFVYKLGRARR